MSEKQQPIVDTGDEPSGIYYFLFWGIVFFFIVLGMRLWYLQVIKGDELRHKSEINRTEVVELTPMRGLIMDRNGQLLVDNKISFDLCVKKSDIEDAPALMAGLAELLGLPEDELTESFEALKGGRNTPPETLVKDLTRDELMKVEINRWRLGGVSIQVTVGRLPLHDVLASHVIGYLGEISRRQLDNERERIEEGIRRLILEGEARAEAKNQAEYELKPHKPGDLVGQSGIEQSMELALQGRRGSVKREVDYLGRWLRDMDVVNPDPGDNLRLTIDTRLQGVAQSLLGQRAGAIVVMDPRNFEILALASSPTFSLRDFTGGISARKWDKLRNDPFLPMVDRAVTGQYPPGSTYKIVVALAALSEGIITPETKFNCTGSLQLGNHTFNCHNRYGHGEVDLKKSLKVSCDVYYYEIGRRMGVDRMAKLSRDMFGLGRRLGVDLLAEESGLIPDSAWKERVHKKRWTPGETLPVSIGQGFVLCTPLQVAQFTAMLANGGSLYRPHLVKEILDVDGRVVKRFEPELISRLDVPPAYIKAVQDGLEAVVAEKDGTGRRAALEGVRISGKTGTSQVVSLKSFQSYTRDTLPYDHHDHAWFTGYAPSDSPEVVVTVLLEHTGGGGAHAAPVAKKMFEACFNQSIVAKELPPPQVQPDQALDLSRRRERRAD